MSKTFSLVIDFLFVVVCFCHLGLTCEDNMGILSTHTVHELVSNMFVKLTCFYIQQASCEVMNLDPNAFKF